MHRNVAERRDITVLENGDFLITYDLGDIRYTIRNALRIPGCPLYFLSWSTGEQEMPFASIPYGDTRFYVAVQGLGFERVYVLVGDSMELVDKDILRRMNAQALARTPLWCQVANMVQERPFGPGGREARRGGTSDIAPGAKVYCHPPKQGDGYERVQVTVHHRVSHRLITTFTKAAWLEHWMVELVYNPRLIAKLNHDWDGTPESKALAESLVEVGKSWAKRKTSR